MTDTFLGYCRRNPSWRNETNLKTSSTTTFRTKNSSILLWSVQLAFSHLTPNEKRQTIKLFMQSSIECMVELWQFTFTNCWDANRNITLFLVQTSTICLWVWLALPTFVIGCAVCTFTVDSCLCLANDWSTKHSAAFPHSLSSVSPDMITQSLRNIGDAVQMTGPNVCPKTL